MIVFAELSSPVRRALGSTALMGAGAVVGSITGAAAHCSRGKSRFAAHGNRFPQQSTGLPTLHRIDFVRSCGDFHRAGEATSMTLVDPLLPSATCITKLAPIAVQRPSRTDRLLACPRGQSPLNRTCT